VTPIFLHNKYCLNYQKIMSELTYKDYPFLKELDLNEDNLGVYYGQWVGSGPVITSYNPTTGKPIARIKGGSMEDYEMCLKKNE